jgi:hypothetical protein
LAGAFFAGAFRAVVLRAADFRTMVASPLGLRTSITA